MIDPRVLIPLDIDKITESVRKTGKLLVVQEAPRRGAFGGEIVAEVAERLNGQNIKFKRLGSLNAPIGVGCVEYFIVPKEENICNAAKELCAD